MSNSKHLLTYLLTYLLRYVGMARHVTVDPGQLRVRDTERIARTEIKNTISWDHVSEQVH